MSAVLRAAALLVAAVLAVSEPAKAAIVPLAERTAGLERHDGFLPYYWDARSGQLLLEASAVSGEFLYGAGLAGGAGLLEASLDRGQLGDLGLCRFERVGPRVLLHQVQTVHRSGTPDAERSRVVAESFPSAVLAALPVVAETGSTLLVDATEFLLRDTSIAGSLKDGQLGEWRQDAARSALNFERTGSFARNTEIEAVLTFASDNAAPAARNVSPDGRTLSLRVHHTFLKLPEPGYAPRRLDPRVGFIPQRHLDHTAPSASRSSASWPRAGVSRRRTRKRPSRRRSSPSCTTSTRECPSPSAPR
jgi:hypothetical protein